MTVIGLDDTDSRTLGMCTTYVAARLADRLAEEGHVERTLLVRLNPAVEHKTRGNAALGIHCDVTPERALELGKAALQRAAIEDEQTNPGLVVADCPPEAVPESVGQFAADAVQQKHERDTARKLADDAGFAVAVEGNGRGVIGALAAVGAWTAFEEWTYECISYREPPRWGTEREVDAESLFAAADTGYPTVWDTVDREEDELVCVPRTPCPILHGIRGDDPDAVRDVADTIESELVDRQQVFLTNQGTDAHLQDGTVATVSDGGAYRLTAEVVAAPETRQGGHVFLTVGDPDVARLDVAAFEPTKRFRDHVRNLRVGDRITVCGEVSNGTLKLEKFAVRELVETELVTPDCPDCGNSMKSAGRNAGYRCRACSTSADGKVSRPLDRDLDVGWYEVPPCARRHIAKPLVRGGFDAPTHPEW
ncbi:tRNA(Ile)(2)-agmatinylcytidine synthase [Halovenus salina]|uniref:tRNA(Ile)(2)-agmatinylcytidine synthase n=1 Tax=Halovenus salina TaxID=1510225 RepID=UPI002260C9F6|nr:tRNA(Ile)(2)-agmatinylcytidine synthase [Halovenus salina]